jgi:poly-gamma-glutamate capsule biosynthesis protein CapA/YwtB (metallophosphatase superfamily)
MFLKNSRKDFPLGGLFFFLILVFCVAAACREPGAKEANQAPLALALSTSAPETPAIAPDTIVPPKSATVIGVGDMMLGTNYPSSSYLPPNGGRDLLAEVRDILRGADVTFGNLEGTILDKGGTPKSCRDPSICYVFRSPESYVEHFVDAGFDALSLANNHSGDFGPEGRKRTMEVLKAAGIHYAGLANIAETAIFERAGLRFGLCAFAPNTGACDLRDIPRAKQIVRQLKEKVDIVIVSFHGGAEGPNHQHVPRRTETYLGENRGDVHKFAHEVIDAGADIVFGHGPHVTRAIELYKDRFIAYSLGNFCTYGRFNLNGPAGIAPIVKIRVNERGEFLDGEIIPTYQQKTHGPKIDPQKRVIQRMIELTKTDFSETPLVIEPDGKIRKKETAGLGTNSD